MTLGISYFSLRDRLVVAILVFLVIIVYWPGLSGGFIFDDFGNLVDNRALASGGLHAHFWAAVFSSGSGPTDRPLSMLTFAIQAWFTGLAPWPLKFVNVLLHATNGILIFALTRAILGFIYAGRFTTSPPIVLASATLSGSKVRGPCHWLICPSTLALFVTAAWLFSPMQLTAVLYVIQRMESLSALFVLAGLLLYWHGRMRLMDGKTGGWWRILVGLLGGTMLAVLAKETGVMLPVYAFLLEWLVLRWRGVAGFEPKLFLLYALILFLPGIAGLLLTLPGALNGSAYEGRPFDMTQRLWTEGRVLVDYLHWLIAPSPNALSLYHDDIRISTGWLSPWTSAASWALIAGLIGFALWFKNRAPLFALGVLWFFAGHALVSTYLPLELVYEHRNYLPSLGVFIALFGLIYAWRPMDPERRALMRTITVSGVAALIALYAGFTALRAQIWGNSYRLAYFEATTHPDSPRASYDLARTMMILAPGTNNSMFQMGFTQMEKTAKLPGASLQADQAMIFMAAKNKLKVEPVWWNALRAKIDRQPPSAEDVGALYSLINCGTNGVCKYTKQDQAELGKTLAFAAVRYPRDGGIITLYANYAANVAHDIPLAYSLMQRAVARAPGNFNYWKNLVTMQIALDDIPEAQASIERMKELNSLGKYNAGISTVENMLLDKRKRNASSQS